MQALSPRAASASISQAPLINHVMPVTTVKAMTFTARQSSPRRTCTPLLDRAAEARAFHALHALGPEAVCSCIVRSAGSIGIAADHSPFADEPTPSPVPTFQPHIAGLTVPELCRLEEELLAIAAKPAVGQSTAPALLVAYLSSCDDQAAARLLATPALQPLLTRRSRHGEAVLHYAVQHKLLNVIERLLTRSPDPAALIGAKSILGIDPLFLACMQGSVEVVQALLLHPATVALAPAVPPGRWNALMSAALDGHVQIAALLLGSATGTAQALATDEHGRNVLMYAVMEGQLAVAELLLAHSSAFAQALALDEDGQNALALAIGAGHLALVRLLLAHPASAGQVIEVTNDGDDALRIAVRCGNGAIVAMLLDDPMAEILLDGANSSNQNALMLAAQAGHAGILVLLLAAMDPEQVNARDVDGCNALMLAAQNGHVDVVRMLLANTRAVHQVLDQDRRGLNALTHATMAGSVEAVVALLDDLSALGQVVAISDATFDFMITEVLKEGIEELLTLAGLPMAGAADDRASVNKRYTLKELAPYCPPRVRLKLLPVIARKLAEKHAGKAAAAGGKGGRGD